MSRVNSDQEISLFRSRITNRRLDDQTLRILESLLVSKDSSSLMRLKSTFQGFMRSESLSILREAAERDFDHKLLVLQFFVHAFALVGDIESCLAMKYEALLLRELKSAECDWLKVSHTEWISFAQNSLEYGFNSIATQACDHALSSLRQISAADIRANKIFDNGELIKTVKKLKDSAIKFAASSSVQAQAAEYLEKRRVEKRKIDPSFSGVSQSATTQFINGIKKRNERKLSSCHKRNKAGWNIDGSTKGPSQGRTWSGFGCTFC